MDWVLYLVAALLGVTLAAFGLRWFWNRQKAGPCPAWLGWLVEIDNPLLRNNRAGVILNHLGVPPGAKVVDVGCGPGRLTIPLAREVGPQGEVVALDLQPEMLRRVQAKAAAAGLTNIRCVEAAAGTGQLAAETFDFALLVNVLGELSEPAAALREIFAALRPDGVLSVTEAVLDPHFVSRSRALRLAEEAGYVLKAEFGGRWAFTLHLKKPAARPGAGAARSSL